MLIFLHNRHIYHGLMSKDVEEIIRFLSARSRSWMNQWPQWPWPALKAFTTAVVEAHGTKKRARCSYEPQLQWRAVRLPPEETAPEFDGSCVLLSYGSWTIYWSLVEHGDQNACIGIMMFVVSCTASRHHREWYKTISMQVIESVRTICSCPSPLMLEYDRQMPATVQHSVSQHHQLEGFLFQPHYSSIDND